MAIRDGNKFDELDLFDSLKRHPLYGKAISMLPEDRRKFIHEYMRSIADNIQSGVWSKIGTAMQEEAEKRTGKIPDEKIIKDS
jgi:hypothetical protein